MNKVLVVGDANVDIVVHFPQYLNNDRTKVKYSEPRFCLGGTAANTASGLQRLGVSTSFAGTIGQDSYGKFVQESLHNQGIDITNLNVDAGVETVGVFAFVDEYGERYLWAWPRKNQAFKELTWNASLQQSVRKSRWVHASGMCMSFPGSAQQTMLTIFKEASANNIPISFDLNCRCDDRQIDSDFMTYLHEALALSTFILGSGPEELEHIGPGDWRENAQSFANQGHTVIARDGANGAYIYSPSTIETKTNCVQIPAFNVEVIDTIGAGDAFDAGFISGMLQGKDLYDAVVYANGVSGYTVSHIGAYSTPTKQQLTNFLTNTIQRSQYETVS